MYARRDSLWFSGHLISKVGLFKKDSHFSKSQCLCLFLLQRTFKRYQAHTVYHYFLFQYCAMFSYYTTVQMRLLWNVYMPYMRQIMLVKKKNSLNACGTSTSELELCAYIALLLQYWDIFCTSFINSALPWNFLQIPTVNLDFFLGKGNLWLNLHLPCSATLWQSWQWVC